MASQGRRKPRTCTECYKLIGERDEMEERVNRIAEALGLSEEEMQWSNLNDVGERCVEKAKELRQTDAALAGPPKFESPEIQDQFQDSENVCKHGQAVGEAVSTLDALVIAKQIIDEWKEDADGRVHVHKDVICKAIDAAFYEAQRAVGTSGSPTEEPLRRISNVEAALRLMSTSDSLGVSEKQSIFSACEELRDALRSQPVPARPNKYHVANAQRRMPMSAYDEKCEELAEYFLRGIAGAEDLRQQGIHELAQVIQDAVENWFAGAVKGNTLQS